MRLRPRSLLGLLVFGGCVVVPASQRRPPGDPQLLPPPATQPTAPPSPSSSPSPTASGYLGCFIDAGDRDLPGAEWSDSQMTVPRCVEHCRAKGFTYAGAQYYSYCFCGPSFGKHGRAQESECAASCSGDASQICGGTWRSSIFSTGGSGAPAPVVTTPTPPAPTPPAQTAAQPGRYLTVQVSGKQAIADWANAPTPQGAWVSIVKVGTADDKHDGIWKYTEQKSSGRLEYPLAPGSYEARFYGDSGYSKLLDRVRFEVAPVTAGPIGRYLNVQVDARRVVITNWANAPTSNGTWVSVVPAGTADTTHVGRWKYTDKQPSGTYESGPWAAGDYEARFYADSGYSQLVDRVRFRID